MKNKSLASILGLINHHDLPEPLKCEVIECFSMRANIAGASRCYSHHILEIESQKGLMNCIELIDFVIKQQINWIDKIRSNRE